MRKGLRISPSEVKAHTLNFNDSKDKAQKSFRKEKSNMKKLLKVTLSALVALSMLLSLSAVSFAAAPDNVLSSQVEFYTDGSGGVYAEAFVRDLSGAAKPAMLIIAAYDQNNKLIDAKTAAGANRVLKTEAVTEADAAKITAFVWENDGMKVISPTAVYKQEGYGMDDVLAKLEITFDGVPFETYMGTSFNPETTTYTKTFTESAVVPNVKVIVPDNAASAIVASDEYRTKITIEHSAGLDPDGSVSGDIIRPTYGDWTKTYTINYNIEKDNSKISFAEIDFLNSSELISAGVMANAYNGSTSWVVDRLDAANTLTNLWQTEVTLGGEIAKKVKIDLTGNPYQAALVVIKAADGSDEKVVVNPVFAPNDELTSASPLTETENRRARKGYDEDADKNIYYTKSLETPVTWTSGATTKQLSVYYGLDETDYAYNTGSDWTNRIPIDGGQGIRSLPDSIKGAEYIPSDYESKSDGSFEFYIGSDADIMVYTKPAVTGVSVNDSALESQVLAGDDQIAVCNMGTVWDFRNYKEGYEQYKNLLLAYLMNNGCEPTDSEGAVKDYKLTEYTLTLFNDRENTSPDTDEDWRNRRGIVLRDATGGIVKPSEDPRFWNNFGEAGQTAKSPEEIMDLFDESEEVATITANPVATELAYADSGLSGASAQPKFALFDYNIETGESNPDYEFWSDRSYKLYKYNTIFDIKGLTTVVPSVEWPQAGAGSTYEDYTQTNNAWYTFKVTRPSEILLFTSGTYAFAYWECAQGQNWVPIFSTEDAEDVVNSSIILEGGTGFKAPGQSLSVKYVEAGETVTIYAPKMMQMSYAVFIRPLD